MSQGHNPVSVTFTERSTSATVSLHELSMRKDSNNFWLFLSGLRRGVIQAKDSNGFQLLNSTIKVVSSPQRLGKRDVDGFVLILGDNA